MNISKTVYDNFLNVLEKKIGEKEFEEALEKTKKIDNKHYSEIILVEELKNIISEYRKKDVVLNENIEKMQVILPGNPEIVFKLGIEAVRNGAALILNIEDFCLAQNTMIVQVLNETLKMCKLLDEIKLNNLLKDEKIVELSKSVDLSICVGNSNDYNALISKIPNLKFYPYNVLELYSDSNELEDVRKAVYDYAVRNQFEIEIYDMDLEIDEVIEEMNRDGYGFCSILLSKDKEKIEKFKNGIKSKYVIINENPFKKLKFELDLKGC